ncbi:hypothetical protein GOP47_0025920 [Adiantum capillus-veneris]|uniref:PPPDE domain-containing protein n=1 Tax=Adiantum capillus-veneris TaxID=13818 RepID=A0A9D4U0Z4_ADICA|nr:hypothetical protein GOP47_0025920 [Adiantum capillus-veneris]
MMTEVFLHVYDVTCSPSAATNTAVVHLNRLLRGGIRLGGIFHSAVEVYDSEEWSFGYSGSGSGVFSCPHKLNVLYSYRETISLGHTSLSRLKVTQVLFELGREWPGSSYDLLSRNCNHFCDALCERLGVQKLPAWINRFAHVGVVAVEALENTAKRLRQAKSGIVSATKLVFHFFVRVNYSSSAISPDPGSHLPIIPNRANMNASRWTFFKVRSVRRSSIFISMKCFGSRKEAMVGREYVERL